MGARTGRVSKEYKLSRRLNAQDELGELDVAAGSRTVADNDQKGRTESMNGAFHAHLGMADSRFK